MFHLPLPLPHRSRLLAIFALLAGAWGTAGPGAQAATPRPLNVVLIVADDLGAHDLGVTGSTFHETPHLDRLAADGLRFTQAYSACTVCSPSRAAILTGRYPARLKLTDWIKGHERPEAKLRVPDWTMHLPLTEVTLAEHLQRAGFFTGHLGKWHQGGEGFEPEKQGFAVNLGGDHRGQPPSYFSPYGLPRLPDGPPGEYLTDREGEEAVKFIQAHRDQPFFLNYWPYAVHTPLQAPAELIAKYTAKASRLGGRQTNATYAAMLERLDTAVGRIRDALATHGLTDRTLVVFTSDNGGLVLGRQPPTSNHPLNAGKGSPFEGGHRVPLIAAWPGVTRAGAVCAEPVMGIDLLPTLLDAVGLAASTGKVDGVSLVPVLRDPTRTLGRALFWHYPHYHPGGATPYAAVRAGDWKLVQYYETGINALFNLVTDPGESRDLGPEQPAKAMELARQLFAWQGNVGAQWPMPNPAWKQPTLAAQPDGRIVLHSRDAAVRSEVLRYEPQPFKNTLGWWVKTNDFAEWTFAVPRPGRYELSVLQGCGNGSGGSEVAFTVGAQQQVMAVLETGGFQNFTNRVVGQFALEAGNQTLSVKPLRKPGGAVMDLREATLRPLP